MNNLVYKIDEFEKCSTNINTFIFALEDEIRSTSCLKYALEKKPLLKNIIILKYSAGIYLDDPKNISDKYNLVNITITSNPVEFITTLTALEKTIWSDDVFIDISCIRIPEMFTLMKFFKINPENIKLSVVYSVPYDYNFSKEPFTSYKSHIGDLTTYELLGYSGVGGEMENDLFLFMGFEGALALKIIEETSYKELVLVNNLPSFSPKYKDISVINNYRLMSDHKNKIFFTPADNPYETYNLLNESIDNEIGACIAPLSSKLVALGACLYALDNEKTRVIYPVSQKYSSTNTVETYKSYVYSINLSC